MQAIVYDRYGSADQLRLEEIDQPTPGPGEILIRVVASAVNSWDWHLLHGMLFERLMFGAFRPQHRILGSEIAGVVEAVGPGVTEFNPGDEVFGDLSTSDWGGFAEYAVGRADSMAHKPADVSFEDAATLPQSGLLALHCLRERWPDRPGDRVLINGGGGAAGTIALQIAKHLGAQVTCVDRGGKLEMLRSLGADIVIDYQREDYTRTSDRYDLILDVSSHRGFLDVRRALEPDGVYVMTGGPVLRIVYFGLVAPIATRIDRRTYTIRTHTLDRDDLMWVTDRVAAGDITPAIERTYSLEDVPDALRYFDTGEVKGKLVIMH